MGVGAKFLDAIPTAFNEQRLSMPPDTFRIALCIMLGIRLGGSTETPLFNRLKCDCSRKTDMDDHMNHCYSCAKGGVPTQVHHAVRNALNDMRVESRIPGGIEKTTYEEIDDDGRSHRNIDADVAFYIPIMPNATQPKLAVDVRTVNPSTIASKKDKAYLLANKQAAVNHADALKHTMAKVIRCQSKNFDFESCTIDIFGGTHEKAIKVFKAMAEKAAQGGFWMNRPKELMRSWMVHLSTAVYRTYAGCLISRTANLLWAKHGDDFMARGGNFMGATRAAAAIAVSIA